MDSSEKLNSSWNLPTSSPVVKFNGPDGGLGEGSMVMKCVTE